MKKEIVLIFALSLFSNISFAKKRVVRIASVGFPAPFSTTVCPNGQKVCGVERTLFDQVCKIQKVRCEWGLVPWAKTKELGAFGVGGALYNLVKPGRNGKFKYDAVVNLVRNTEERRNRGVLFTFPYFRGEHVLFGGKRISKVINKRLDKNGYPKSIEYPLGRKLRISTISGALSKDLKEMYENSRYIELIIFPKSGDAIEALVKGDTDLYLSLASAKKEIHSFNGGKLFKIVSTINMSSTHPPRLGAAMATRMNEKGWAIVKLFNDGLLKLRKSGLYQKIYEAGLGIDPWPCRGAPFLKNDSKCRR